MKMLTRKNGFLQDLSGGVVSVVAVAIVMIIGVLIAVQAKSVSTDGNVTLISNAAVSAIVVGAGFLGILIIAVIGAVAVGLILRAFGGTK